MHSADRLSQLTNRQLNKLKLSPTSETSSFRNWNKISQISHSWRRELKANNTNVPSYFKSAPHLFSSESRLDQHFHTLNQSSKWCHVSFTPTLKKPLISIKVHWLRIGTRILSYRLSSDQSKMNSTKIPPYPNNNQLLKLKCKAAFRCSNHH